MSTLEFKKNKNVLGHDSLNDYWELSEYLYSMSRNNDPGEIERCSDDIIKKWEETIIIDGMSDSIEDITQLIVYHLDCGEKMCNLAVIAENKEVLEFLHEEGHTGDVEIALAAHNCSVDFLDWMYHSRIKWDGSLQFLDDIENECILEFLEKNMKNWKDNIFH